MWKISRKRKCSYINYILIINDDYNFVLLIISQPYLIFKDIIRVGTGAAVQERFGGFFSYSTWEFRVLLSGQFPRYFIFLRLDFLTVVINHLYYMYFSHQWWKKLRCFKYANVFPGVDIELSFWLSTEIVRTLSVTNNSRPMEPFILYPD
jgi:hypothetical protein